MPDYNLHGLNTRDFQHLVQAIARKIIAAGVTSFGDGRDGARDLSFRGKMQYPSSVAAWDGYLILGCKFQIKPGGSPKKDADWAIKQLEADLKKFSVKRRRLQKPDFYIFATNVALTAVADSGGRDRTEAVLEKFKTAHGLFGYGIWDYNDIRGFLDGDADLRAAYGHFITAGDVLSQLSAALSPMKPNFMDVMHSFLQKKLIADMSAKLQSAGDDPEIQIPLARVFVDLPISNTPESAALDGVQRTKDVPTIVSQMLISGSSVLRRSLTVDADDRTYRSLSRFVVVGGPGQGKSTVGQYLCQLYRAAILKDRPPSRLDEKVRAIITQFETQRKSAGGLPVARRFPVRIELRTFAHALATEPALTLLEYLTRDFSRLGGSAVSIEDTKKWLSLYPWILILDGLDEVPPSSNRSEVVREIEHFRIDAASQDCDLLTIATTRPQSYTHEFARELFSHLYLLPLTSNEALHYGRRLADARCGADDRRRDELVRSLEKACKNQSTARLMQTPLQVTIMATLLEETGEPPQQRYRLFAEYYRTIYKRETRRRLLGGILSERQTDIDAIHAQTGLLLHAAAERGVRPNTSKGRPEESETALSDDQFRGLVKRRLDHIGVTEPRATEILDRITDTTLQRLVFLVRQVEGWVRFDIASFKEFMAAEAIMFGDDETVRQRLETLAPASFWRNAVLFAVGKVFVQREHMLDNIIEICTGLNEEIVAARVIGERTAGEAAKAVLWGSRLALDILSDGTARQFPEYEIRLARVALELLRVHDITCAVRLAGVYNDELETLYREAIMDRLGQANCWDQLGAWHLLLSLAEREILWANHMLDVHWPHNFEFTRSIMSSREGRGLIDMPVRQILHLGTKISPSWLIGYLHRMVEPDELEEPWKVIISYLSIRAHAFHVRNKSDWRELFEVFKVVPAGIGGDLKESFSKAGSGDPLWNPYVAGARFGANPSAESLSEELKNVADGWEPTADYWVPSLPWPFATLIAAAQTKEDLLRFASEAAAQRFGTLEDWQAAESRWRSQGIDNNDFSAMTKENWPFDAGISKSGFPFALFGRDAVVPSNIAECYSFDVGNVISRLRAVSGPVCTWMARLLLRSLEYPYYYRSRPNSLLKNLGASRRGC